VLKKRETPYHPGPWISEPHPYREWSEFMTPAAGFNKWVGANILRNRNKEKKEKKKKGASERVGGSSGEKEAEKIKRERKR